MSAPPWPLPPILALASLGHILEAEHGASPDRPQNRQRPAAHRPIARRTVSALAAVLFAAARAPLSVGLNFAFSLP